MIVMMMLSSLQYANALPGTCSLVGDCDIGTGTNSLCQSCDILASGSPCDDVEYACTNGVCYDIANAQNIKTAPIKFACDPADNAWYYESIFTLLFDIKGSPLLPSPGVAGCGLDENLTIISTTPANCATASLFYTTPKQGYIEFQKNVPCTIVFQLDPIVVANVKVKSLASVTDIPATTFIIEIYDECDPAKLTLEHVADPKYSDKNNNAEIVLDQATYFASSKYSVEVILGQFDTVCPYFLIPEAAYYLTTSNTDVRTLCPVTYVNLSPGIFYDSLSSGTANIDAIYKYELDPTKLQVAGTYTLDFQATGFVETTYTAPVVNRIFELTVKVCDNNLATFGDFEQSPEIWKQLDSVLTPFDVVSCDPCIYPLHIWYSTGNAAPYFKFYDLTYLDTSDTTIDRKINCPITVTITSPTNSFWSVPPVIAGIDTTDPLNPITSYTTTLQAPFDSTTDTYDLEIQYQAYTVASSSIVTALKRFSLMIKSCVDDGTKFQYGHFAQVSVSEYADAAPIQVQRSDAPQAPVWTTVGIAQEQTATIYIQLGVTAPYFEFHEMTYDQILPLEDIRPNCPITYTHSSTDFDIITLISGTSGVNGIYKVQLADALKTTAGTYTLDIVGTGKYSTVSHTNRFILTIINLCDEVFTNGRGLYGVNLLSDVKYSNYNNIAANIPSSWTSDQPFVGTYQAAAGAILDTWEETKYIISAPLIPSAISPYVIAAVTQPRFEFTDISYVDTRDLYDLRLKCPITYTTTSINFDLIQMNPYTAPSTPGSIWLNLKTPDSIVPNTYTAEVEGIASGDTSGLGFKIKFILNLKDFCTEIASIGTLGIPTQSMKYSNYKPTATDIPTTAIDQITPLIHPFIPASGAILDTWEETKYIVYNLANPDSSPYLDPLANSPFFEFTDMTYTYVDAASATIDIRQTCPITYTTVDLAGTFAYSLISGTEGYNGVYKVALDNANEKTPNQYIVEVTGTAFKNLINPFKIKFILNLKDFCNEMASSSTLGPPDPLSVTYSNYNTAPNTIPSISTTDPNQPEPGTFTAGAMPTWEETKFIVYNLPKLAGSPYLDPLANKPYFEFKDMTYLNGLTSIRNSCPITYTPLVNVLPSPSHFVYSVTSGAEGYTGVYRITLDIATPAGYEVPGTYSFEVKGSAAPHIATPFKIKFILILKDFCTTGAYLSTLTPTPAEQAVIDLYFSYSVLESNPPSAISSNQFDIKKQFYVKAIYCPIDYVLEYSDSNSGPWTLMQPDGSQSPTDLFYQNTEASALLPEFAYFIQKSAVTNAVAKIYYIKMQATISAQTVPPLIYIFKHEIVPDCQAVVITTSGKADVDYIKGDAMNPEPMPVFTAPYELVNFLQCPIRYELCFMDRKPSVDPSYPKNQCLLDDVSNSNILHLLNNKNFNVPPYNSTLPNNIEIGLYNVDNTFGLDVQFGHKLEMTLQGYLWGYTSPQVLTTFNINLIPQCKDVKMVPGSYSSNPNSPSTFFHKSYIAAKDLTFVVGPAEGEQLLSNNYEVPAFASPDLNCPHDFKIEWFNPDSAVNAYQDIERPDPLTLATESFYQQVDDVNGVKSRRFFINPQLITNEQAGMVYTLRVSGYINHLRTVPLPKEVDQNLIYHYIEITILPKCSLEAITPPDNSIPLPLIQYTFNQASQTTHTFAPFTIVPHLMDSGKLLSEFCYISYSIWWEDQFGKVQKSLTINSLDQIVTFVETTRTINVQYTASNGFLNLHDRNSQINLKIIGILKGSLDDRPVGNDNSDFQAESIYELVFKKVTLQVNKDCSQVTISCATPKTLLEYIISSPVPLPTQTSVKSNDDYCYLEYNMQLKDPSPSINYVPITKDSSKSLVSPFDKFYQGDDISNALASKTFTYIGQQTCLDATKLISSFVSTNAYDNANSCSIQCFKNPLCVNFEIQTIANVGKCFLFTSGCSPSISLDTQYYEPPSRLSDLLYIQGDKLTNTDASLDLDSYQLKIVPLKIGDFASNTLSSCEQLIEIKIIADCTLESIILGTLDATQQIAWNNQQQIDYTFNTATQEVTFVSFTSSLPVHCPVIYSLQWYDFFGDVQTDLTPINQLVTYNNATNLFQMSFIAGAGRNNGFLNNHDINDIIKFEHLGQLKGWDSMLPTAKLPFKAEVNLKLIKDCNAVEINADTQDSVLPEIVLINNAQVALQMSTFTQKATASDDYCPTTFDLYQWVNQSPVKEQNERYRVTADDGVQDTWVVVIKESNKVATNDVFFQSDDIISEAAYLNTYCSVSQIPTNRISQGLLATTLDACKASCTADAACLEYAFGKSGSNKDYCDLFSSSCSSYDNTAGLDYDIYQKKSDLKPALLARGTCTGGTPAPFPSPFLTHNAESCNMECHKVSCKQFSVVMSGVDKGKCYTYATESCTNTAGISNYYKPSRRSSTWFNVQTSTETNNDKAGRYTLQARGCVLNSAGVCNANQAIHEIQIEIQADCKLETINEVLTGGSWTPETNPKAAYVFKTPLQSYTLDPKLVSSKPSFVNPAVPLEPPFQVHCDIFYPPDTNDIQFKVSNRRIVPPDISKLYFDYATRVSTSFPLKNWDQALLTFDLESSINNQYSNENGENTDITDIDNNANVYDIMVTATLRGANIGDPPKDVTFQITLTKDCSLSKGVVLTPQATPIGDISYTLSTASQSVQYKPPTRSDIYCGIITKILVSQESGPEYDYRDTSFGFGLDISSQESYLIQNDTTRLTGQDQIINILSSHAKSDWALLNKFLINGKDPTTWTVTFVTGYGDAETASNLKDETRHSFTLNLKNWCTTLKIEPKNNINTIGPYTYQIWEAPSVINIGPFIMTWAWLDLSAANAPVVDYSSAVKMSNVLSECGQWVVELRNVTNGDTAFDPSIITFSYNPVGTSEATITVFSEDVYQSVSWSQGMTPNLKESIQYTEKKQRITRLRYTAYLAQFIELKQTSSDWIEFDMNVQYDCWDPVKICLQPSNDQKQTIAALDSSKQVSRGTQCTNRQHNEDAYQYSPREFSVNENGIDIVWSIPLMTVDPKCASEVKMEKIELVPRSGVDISAKEILYPSPELSYDVVKREFQVKGLELNEYSQTLSIKIYAQIIRKRSDGSLVNMDFEFPLLTEVFALQKLVIRACEIQRITPARIGQYSYSIGEKARTHIITEPFIVYPICKQYVRTYVSNFVSSRDAKMKVEAQNSTLPVTLSSSANKKKYTFVSFDPSNPKLLAWEIYTPDRLLDHTMYEFSAEIVFGPDVVWASTYEPNGQSVIWDLNVIYNPYYPDNVPPVLLMNLEPMVMALGEKKEVFLAGKDFSNDTVKVEIRYQTDPTVAKNFITWQSVDPNIENNYPGKVHNFETTFSIAPTEQNQGGSWLVHIKLIDQKRDNERGSDSLIRIYKLIVMVTIPAAEVKFTEATSISNVGEVLDSYGCIDYEPIKTIGFAVEALKNCKAACVEETKCTHIVLKGSFCELYEKCTIIVQEGSNVRVKQNQELKWAGFKARFSKFSTKGNFTITFDQKVRPYPKEVYSAWDFEYTQTIIYLRVLPGQGQDASKTLIERYNVTEWTDSKIVLTVEFKDPVWISSSGSEPDRIQAIFLQNDWFQGKADARLKVYANSQVNGTIPSQLPPGGYTENLQALAGGAQNAMWAVTAAQLIANTVLANSMHSLYGLIQTLQVVTHHQGANTPFPANCQELNAAISRITQLDVVPPEIVTYFKIWRYFEPERVEELDDSTVNTTNSDASHLRHLVSGESVGEQAKTSFLDEEGVDEYLAPVVETFADPEAATKGIHTAGYESHDMIENLQSLVLVIMAGVFIIMLLPLLGLGKLCFPRCGKTYNYLRNLVFWNGLLRLLVEGYLELSIDVMLNLRIMLYRYEIYGTLLPSILTYQEIISLMLTFIFTILLWVLPFVPPIYLYRNADKIRHAQAYNRKEYDLMRAQYGAFFEGLDLRRTPAKWYLFAFVVRRMILGGTLVYLPDDPAIQIVAIVYLNMGAFLFQGLCRPFTTRAQNAMELYNECMILVCCYHLFVFTDFVRDPNPSFDVGLSYVLITAKLVFVNVCNIVYTIGRGLYRKWVGRQQKRRYLKEIERLAEAKVAPQMSLLDPTKTIAEAVEDEKKEFIVREKIRLRFMKTQEMMAGKINVDQFQFQTQDATLEKQIKVQGIYKMEGTMLSERCHAARRPVNAVPRTIIGALNPQVNPFKAQEEYNNQVGRNNGVTVKYQRASVVNSGKKPLPRHKAVNPLRLSLSAIPEETYDAVVDPSTEQDQEQHGDPASAKDLQVIKTAFFINKFRNLHNMTPSPGKPQSPPKIFEKDALNINNDDQITKLIKKALSPEQSSRPMLENDTSPQRSDSQLQESDIIQPKRMSLQEFLRRKRQSEIALAEPSMPIRPPTPKFNNVPQLPHPKLPALKEFIAQKRERERLEELTPQGEIETDD